jgi:hypothetical protein
LAADATTTAFTFLYGTLHGDSQFMSYVTGVYADIAPQGTLPDYCIISQQSGMDVLSATAKRIYSNLLFAVKLVGPASDYSNLSAAYQRADALLALVRNTSGILACYREQMYALPEPELVNGVPWTNLIGIYRIEV